MREYAPQRGSLVARQPERLARAIFFQARSSASLRHAKFDHPEQAMTDLALIEGSVPRSKLSIANGDDSPVFSFSSAFDAPSVNLRDRLSEF